MSQGLLDPKALEMIACRRSLDEVVLAPSYILREAWQLDEKHSFAHFLGLSLSNLLGGGFASDRTSTSASQTATTSPPLQLDQALLEYLQSHHLEGQIDVGHRHCRADWNLTDENINEELDRSDQIGVSFYFALRWLQYEIENIKVKRN